jgi:hypothetical protein
VKLDVAVVLRLVTIGWSFAVNLLDSGAQVSYATVTAIPCRTLFLTTCPEFPAPRLATIAWLVRLIGDWARLHV